MAQINNRVGYVFLDTCRSV